MKFPSMQSVAILPGPPPVNWANDAFQLEGQAVLNADEAAKGLLNRLLDGRGDGDGMAEMEALAVISTFMRGLYYPMDPCRRATLEDFATLLDYVRSSAAATTAWTAFCHCFSQAVVLQHVTNQAMMSANKAVERQPSQSVAALAMAVAACPSQEGRTAVRKLAAEGMLVADFGAMELFAAEPSGLVEAARSHVRKCIEAFMEKMKHAEGEAK